jgi:hypothetical protein
MVLQSLYSLHMALEKLGGWPRMWRLNRNPFRNRGEKHVKLHDVRFLLLKSNHHFSIR